MRYSAVQEDSYGVGLGQETPPNNVDGSMMAATGDSEPGGGSTAKEGSMISNLPLLLANGYPTTLEKISLPDLERFITFMVQCSLGHYTAEVITEPQWWPKEIKFSIPLVRPKKINKGYMANLKKLVFRCYTYHRSEYLLRFSSYLSRYPRDKLEYVNNWDSTTSLYLKTTGKLLVTFRNENMNYDKKVQNSRKKLLPVNRENNDSSLTKCLRRRPNQKQAPSPAMVEPAIEDIYLCDNCDAEFIGLNLMKEHEKLCYRVEPRPPTPIDVEDPPEITQNQFMDYFHLQSKNSPDSNQNINKTTTFDTSTQNRTSSRIRSSVNLSRCPTIPFSSPAGLAIGKKSKMMTELIQQERLDRIERHLTAPPLCSATKPKWLTKFYEFDRWSVTFKPNRDKTIKADEYVHQYSFTNYNRKPTLNLRSQLLYIACKPLYVDVERLTDERIQELMENPSRYKSPERKVPRIRQRSPSVQSVYEEEHEETELGNEIHPIVIDLEDDDEPPPPLVVAPPPAPPRPVLAQPPVTRSPAVAKVTPMPAARNPFVTARLSPVKPNILKRPRPGSSNSKSVIFVDLCSSDEEMAEKDVSSSVYVSVAERPRESTQKRASLPTGIGNYGAYLASDKYYGKPYIYPADSTTHWLANLNVDGSDQQQQQRHSNSFIGHSVFDNTP